MFGLCERPLQARLGLLFLFCLSFARLFSLLRGGTGFLSSRFAAVLDSFTTGSHGPNRAGLLLRWCRSPTRPPKPHTGPHRGEFGFSLQNELTPPPKGGGAGYHLSWVGRVGSVRSKLGHAGSTGPTLFLAGVASLPGPQNRTQGHTGASLDFTVFS